MTRKILHEDLPDNDCVNKSLILKAFPNIKA